MQKYHMSIRNFATNVGQIFAILGSIFRGREYVFNLDLYIFYNKIKKAYYYIHSYAQYIYPVFGISVNTYM